MCHKHLIMTANATNFKCMCMPLVLLTLTFKTPKNKTKKINK